MTPLRPLFFARRPRISAPAVRLAPVPRRAVSTAELHSRLRDRAFWRAVAANWKPALKIAAVVNVSVLALQAAVHGALQCVEETTRPTPPTWSFAARYFLRRARMANAWNPLAERKSDDETLRMYDRALAHSAGAGTAGDGWAAAMLRKERGRALEEMRRWDAAESEYRAALDVDADAPRLKVEAATRLARIQEWRGDDVAALETLERAVCFAGGPALPPPGDARNSPALLNAVAEMAVFLARRGEIARALELATAVLARRKAAAAADVGDPKRYTEAIGDPCRVAVSEATVGELLFAIGKRDEGLRWTEDAFHKAWELVDYRLACKECAGIAASNLVQMGRILEEEALRAEDGGKKGWWRRGERSGRVQLREAQRIRQEYDIRRMEVDAVRAVKDSDVAKRA